MLLGAQPRTRPGQAPSCAWQLWWGRLQPLVLIPNPLERLCLAASGRAAGRAAQDASWASAKLQMAVTVGQAFVLTSYTVSPNL